MMTQADIIQIEEAPTPAEIVRYVQRQIAGEQTGDPRDPNSPDITPTAKIYGAGKLANGRRAYVPEREELHARIVAGALKNASPCPTGETPSFICVAGGMSVGMTYMQRLMLAEQVVKPENTVVITPLTFLPMHEFAIRSHYQHPEKSPLLVDEYYDVVQKIVDAGIAQGMNVVFVDQADILPPVLEMVKSAKAAGYETAMLALTMTPEAYHAASELWLHKFNRLADHRRGFGDLKEFAQNWPSYTQAFNFAALFETYFHVKDIDKAQDDATRREYTVHRISGAEAGVEAYAMPGRMHEFNLRGQYINEDATTPADARRNYPTAAAPQLIDEAAPVDAAYTGETTTLAGRLKAFQSGDFEQKFVALVRKTSENRAGRAQAETKRAV